ncbi:BNR repeat-containing family member domain-containing protein [Sarocladium implicatum]|nr:BNR repeat-containing family member domain-containing protein [Sarocladium implicatum]
MKSVHGLRMLALGHCALANIVPGSLKTISTATDNSNQAAWWSPLDEAGGYTWLGYVRNPASGSKANNNIMITRVDISTGAIVRDCVRATSSSECTLFSDDLGHNQPSLAVDGDGFVHVFTSMHNNVWRYFRSQEPYSSTTLVNESGDMPDGDVLITYPVIKRDAAGDLWLMVRGEAPGDTSARGGYLYHYQTKAKTWTRIARWAYRTGFAVYPDDIQFSSDGDVHLQWEWSKYPSSVGRHEGSYIRYRPSTGKFTSITGQEVSVPVTQSTPNLVFQPLTSGEIYQNVNSDPPILQSAKMALYEDSAGTVHVQHAYRFQNETSGPWQIRRARSTGTSSSPWAREIVQPSPDTTAALGITHDGTTVRIYYCRKSGSAWVLEKDGSAAWSNTELAAVKGKKVERLQAIMRSDGTDVLYLAAPTNVDSTTGSLYLLDVGGR